MVSFTTCLSTHTSIPTSSAATEARALIAMMATLASMKGIKTLITEKAKAVNVTSYPTANILHKIRFLCTNSGKDNSLEALDTVTAP